MSPRVKSTFVEVRRRVLPTIIQQKYTEAKTAFDRKDFVAAGDGFTQVLRVLDDPDLVAVASQPPLADMRTLARGFKDLSANAAARHLDAGLGPCPGADAVRPPGRSTRQRRPRRQSFRAPLRIYTDGRCAGGAAGRRASGAAAVSTQADVCHAGRRRSRDQRERRRWNHP